MKRSDFIALAGVIVILLPFILISGALDAFINWSNAYPFFSSACKFVVLATFGECLVLRIKKGVYNAPGFGIIPRAIVWACLGILIKCSFIIYGVGTPLVLQQAFNIDPATTSLGAKLFKAFSISAFMNLTFAPIFMTMHNITDRHIMATGGTVRSFFTKPAVLEHIKSIDWNIQYGFVFKKTLIFFWIPAHTITFMMPEEFRVLFAAALGVVLGLIMGFAGGKK